MSEPMTLEQVRDRLRNDGSPAWCIPNEWTCQQLADAIDAHLSQPAQAVDVEKASDAWREAAAAILGKHSRLFRYVCEEAEKLTAALKDSR
jgi:hypothetical protein